MLGDRKQHFLSSCLPCCWYNLCIVLPYHLNLPLFFTMLYDVILRCQQTWVIEKYLSRVWGQTVAFEKVTNLSQLIQTCMVHFQGRPCIGYPANEEDNRLHAFVIFQTPISRKISKTCQKVLHTDTHIKIKSCKECLKLRDSFENKELSHQNTCDFGGLLDSNEVKNSVLLEEMSAGEGNNSELSVNPPSDKNTKNEGHYACKTVVTGLRKNGTFKTIANENLITPLAYHNRLPLL